MGFHVMRIPSAAQSHKTTRLHSNTSRATAQKKKKKKKKGLLVLLRSPRFCWKWKRRFVAPVSTFPPWTCQVFTLTDRLISFFAVLLCFLGLFCADSLTVPEASNTGACLYGGSRRSMIFWLTEEPVWPLGGGCSSVV